MLIIVTRDGKVLEFEPYQWDAIHILIGEGDNVASMFCTLSRSSITYLAAALEAVRQVEEGRYCNG